MLQGNSRRMNSSCARMRANVLGLGFRTCVIGLILLNSLYLRKPAIIFFKISSGIFLGLAYSTSNIQLTMKCARMF